MPDFGRWTSHGGDPSLNEINRTDRFLDALASQQPVYSTDPGEAELAQLLAEWRDDVRTPPLMAPVTPRDASIALRRAVESRKRTRTSLTLVGSAAAAVLFLGGFGAVVAGAGPGDALYGLRTMLFGEQQVTRDDQVVLAAQTQLAEVQQLIDQGQWQAAQDKLQAVTTTVATVDDVGRQQELVTQLQELSVKVETKDANATVPPNAPPITLPVIVDDPATATSSETTTSPSEATTTPSTPSPTPTPSTPLPTPTPSTPSPTPTTPLPTPTTPLPTPTTTLPAVTALPTLTQTTLPTPTPTPLPSLTEAPSDEETTTKPPVLESPAPKTVVTTTTVIPEPADEPR